MKKKAILLITIATAMYMTIGITAFAVEGDKTPIATEAKEAYETATVDVRVKAEVPEDFTGTLSIQFTGKKSKGFTAVLEKESEYTAVIAIPRDLYTYKQHTVTDGYDVKVAKNFVLDEAILNDTYLLPVIVSTTSPNTGSGNEEMNYVTAKIYASPQECDFGGIVELSYSGTNGNTFQVTLNQQNVYTVELPILMDLYTLNDLKISDSYEAQTLYSFNTVDSNDSHKYQVAVKVHEKGTAPTKQEEKTFIMKPVVFQALIPENCPFTGDVTVSYIGNVTYPVELVLKSSEGYTKTIDLPLDTYVLSYAVSHDDVQYTFDARTRFTVGITDESVTIPISIMKDGIVLSNQAEEAAEEIPQQTEVPDNTKEPAVFALLGITLIIILIACFGIRFLLGRKTSHREEETLHKRETLQEKEEKDGVAIDPDPDHEIESDDTADDTKKYALEKGKNLLITLLAGGKQKSETVYAAAKEQGISRSSITRAKKELGIESVRENKQWYFSLPARKE